jgi:MFS family permease
MVGQLFSVSGTWMQNIAQGYLVFQLTDSELWLGIIAMATGLPFLLTAPVAGVIVDRIPRRKLLIITQTTQMILAFILAALTFTDLVQVWHITLLAFLLGMSNAIDAPARQTFVVEMVGREDLHSGIALNSILNSMARVLGPMAAGIALVQLGADWCFLLNGVSFLAVLLSLFIMSVPYPIQNLTSAKPLQQLKAGLAYVRGDSTLLPLLLLTAVVGFFGIPVIRLLPAFADRALHSPDTGFAALSVAQGIGSVVAGLTVGWLGRRFGQGWGVVVTGLIASLSVFVMAFQTTIFLGSLMSGLWGTFVLLEIISLNTLIQSTVPDEFRGRVLSLYTLSLLGLTPFGALAMGAIADYFGTLEAFAFYAVVSAIFSVAVMLRWRGVARLD